MTHKVHWSRLIFHQNIWIGKPFLSCGPAVHYSENWSTSIINHDNMDIINIFLCFDISSKARSYSTLPGHDQILLTYSVIENQRCPIFLKDSQNK